MSVISLTHDSEEEGLRISNVDLLGIRGQTTIKGTAAVRTIVAICSTNYDRLARLLVERGVCEELDCKPLVVQLLRFLLLKVVDNDADNGLLAPSAVVKVAWELLLLFPRDCYSVCGAVFDHDPLEAPGQGAKYMRTLKRYRELYSVEPSPLHWPATPIIGQEYGTKLTGKRRANSEAEEKDVVKELTSKRDVNGGGIDVPEEWECEHCSFTNIGSGEICSTCNRSSCPYLNDEKVGVDADDVAEEKQLEEEERGASLTRFTLKDDNLFKIAMAVQAKVSLKAVLAIYASKICVLYPIDCAVSEGNNGFILLSGPR
jgi:hypothetical protein